MAAGGQPTCGVCERTALSPEGVQVLEIAEYRELGMSWELAMEAACWTGTRDDLRTLARRIGMLLRGRRAPQESPEALGA